MISDRWLSSPVREHVAQPLLPGRAESTVGLARLDAVEADQPHRKAVLHEVDEAVARQIAMSRRERAYKLFAPIMIARRYEHRHRQRREAIADDLIFLVEPAIREISAHHDAIGLRIELQDRIDRILKHRIGIDVAIGALPARPHVEVAELCDDQQVNWSSGRGAAGVACRPHSCLCLTSPSSRRCFP